MFRMQTGTRQRSVAHVSNREVGTYYETFAPTNVIGRGFWPVAQHLPRIDDHTEANNGNRFSKVELRALTYAPALEVDSPS